MLMPSDKIASLMIGYLLLERKNVNRYALHKLNTIWGIAPLSRLYNSCYVADGIPIYPALSFFLTVKLI